jgi:hypothetical protein
MSYFGLLAESSADKNLTTTIITAVATILAALIGKVSWDKVFSVLRRRQFNIPEIMKTRWNADWRHDDGTQFIEDKVAFSKWTRKSQFEGHGEATYGDKEYTYPIVGEVSPNRIVVLTYKAEKYPTEANIGMAALELSSDAEQLDGYWVGRASIEKDGRKMYTLRRGTVKMKKIRS